jgi:hypothetical protein
MRDFHDSDTMWQGAGRMEELLRTEHLLTDVIFEDSLTPERLAPYPVVVLANSTCLSYAQCDAVVQYVEAGGTLLATLESSLRNEWGNPRDNFGLADLFGVDYVATSNESARILVPQTESLKAEFEHFVTFVAPSVKFTLRDGANTEILLSHSSRSINGLSVLSEPYDSGVPAVVRRRIGKGTVYYSGPDVGLGYARDKLKRVAQLTGRLLRNAAQPLVEFDAPSMIEVTALQPEPDRMVVHLLNMSALHANNNRMAPLANIGIKFNQRNITNARLAIAGAGLPLRNNRVTVPAVGYCEVLVVDLAQTSRPSQ